MANRTKATPQRLKRFLAALAETANVSKSAAEVGLQREHLYRLRWEKPEFALEWDKAVELGTAMLEDEAIRRATEGWEEPVFYQGCECGRVRKYSDTLLLAQLKARLPEKYKDRSSAEVTGKGGRDLIPANPAEMTDEQLAAIAAAGGAAAAGAPPGQD